MIVLDYQDRRPLYEQVEEKFRNLILIGALEPGSRMPSVRQLAMELSINPNSIQRAYMQLEQEGLIYPEILLQIVKKCEKSAKLPIQKN